MNSPKTSSTFSIIVHLSKDQRGTPKFAPAYITSYIPRIDPHSGAYHETHHNR